MLKSLIAIPAFLILLVATNCGSHGAKLTWTASTTPQVVYRVYRSNAHLGPYTMIAGALQATSFTDNTVQRGSTYYYVARSFKTVESGNSNEFVASIP